MSVSKRRLFWAFGCLTRFKEKGFLANRLSSTPSSLKALVQSNQIPRFAPYISYKTSCLCNSLYIFIVIFVRCMCHVIFPLDITCLPQISIFSRCNDTLFARLYTESLRNVPDLCTLYRLMSLIHLFADPNTFVIRKLVTRF